MSMLLTGENVFTINAVSRALSDSDYRRLAQELSETRTQLDKLLDALELAKISVSIDDNGNIVLVTPTESSEKASQSPEKSSQSTVEPSWCSATRDEWKELYESATIIDS